MGLGWALASVSQGGYYFLSGDLGPGHQLLVPRRFQKNLFSDVHEKPFFSGLICHKRVAL